MKSKGATEKLSIAIVPPTHHVHARRVSREIQGFLMPFSSQGSTMFGVGNPASIL